MFKCKDCLHCKSCYGKMTAEEKENCKCFTNKTVFGN